MTLPQNGLPISLKQIADEFGDAAPHSLNEFYSATTGVPVSGIIDFDDFYGKSREANIGTILDVDYSTLPYSPAGETALSYDPDQDRFLYVYSDFNNADANYCRVIKINADKTITLGNQYSFGFNGDKKSVDYDTNVNKHVVLFRDNSDDEKIKARSVTINDMSITFGTTITLDSSGNLGDCLIKFDDSSNRFLAVYEDDDGWQVSHWPAHFTLGPPQGVCLVEGGRILTPFWQHGCLWLFQEPYFHLIIACL